MVYILFEIIYSASLSLCVCVCVLKQRFKLLYKMKHMWVTWGLQFRQALFPQKQMGNYSSVSIRKVCLETPLGT